MLLFLQSDFIGSSQRTLHVLNPAIVQWLSAATPTSCYKFSLGFLLPQRFMCQVHASTSQMELGTAVSLSLLQGLPPAQTALKLKAAS